MHCSTLHAAICTACCLLATTSFTTGFSFNGFKQYRLVPLTTKAVSKIRWLEQEFPAEPNPNAGLTFLTMPGQDFKSVDLLVPPAMEQMFLAAVRSTGTMRIRQVHRNFGRLIAESSQQNEHSRAFRSRLRRQAVQTSVPRLTLRHNFYRSFQEIIMVLNQLHRKCNIILPGTCQLKSIGRTYLDNDLMVLRVTKKSSVLQKTKIWIDGGIHAREWISHATVMYIADRLITDLASNTSLVTSILDNHDILMLPMYNPDGYEYSRRQNRMWRKNREPTVNPACPGVDLNRNYGYKWGGNYSTGAPCASSYRGSGPFSAQETAAVQRFIESEKDGMVLFLSFHSYGQSVLIPYGYRKQTYSTTHRAKMTCAAKLASYTMYAINGRFYTYGSGSDLLYEANGGSDDWAHGSLRIPYSFTIELPDEGDHGFLLPAAKVPEVGHETTAGLSALLDTIRRLEAADEDMQQMCKSSWDN